MHSGIGGITVANQETVDWTDCMVGLNGDTGWDYNKPPFKTRSPLTISAGKFILVPYEDITSDDGTRFDPSTHAVNTIVVDCFQGAGASERWWTGTTVKK